MFNRVYSACFILACIQRRLRAACSMNFYASLEYAVGIMIGSCSVIGVLGAKYRNHYAKIVMVGISASASDNTARRTTLLSGMCRIWPR